MNKRTDQHIMGGVKLLDPLRQRYLGISAVSTAIRWVSRLFLAYVVLSLAQNWICLIGLDSFSTNSNPRLSAILFEAQKLLDAYCATRFNQMTLVSSLPFKLPSMNDLASDAANLLIYTFAYLLLSSTLKNNVSTARNNLFHAFDRWRAECIPLIEPDASYDKNGYLDESVFSRSCIATHGYNRYWGSSLLRCRGIVASSLRVQNERIETWYETDSNGNSIRRERVVVDNIFTGLVIAVPAPLPHPAWIVLKPRGSTIASGLTKMRVSSPSLNKTFSIATSDQFAGHRLLTPSMMDNLYEFNNLFSNIVTYSYREGWLYIGAPGSMLYFGNYPGRLAPVTFTSLSLVAKACRDSLNLITNATRSLIPS